MNCDDIAFVRMFWLNRHYKRYIFLQPMLFGKIRGQIAPPGGARGTNAQVQRETKRER